MRISDNDSDRYKRSSTYRNTTTTVPCCRGCCSGDWISHVSCVLLLTDTTVEALQLPLSHIFLTHCVFTIRPLSQYSGWNFAPADLITWLWTNGHGVCPIEIPCFLCTWRVWINSEVNLWFVIRAAKHVKSLASQLKYHALWAKVNHKNDHIFVYVLCKCSSYCNSRIWHTVLMLNITVNMQLVTYYTKI